MDLNVRDKVVVVTGAADGIGYCVAQLLTADGAKVVIADINEKKAEAASAELNATGADSIAVAVDVQDEISVKNMVDRTLKHYGKIDMLVNNAGIGYFKTLEEETMDEWHRVLAINLTGVHLCSREVYPHMKRQNSGRIISVASLGGQVGGMKVTPGYVASKAGVAALMKSYARNGGKHGILANSVAPGPTETNMARGRYNADGTMIGRLAEPMDVAKVIFFLCTNLADYLTGVTIDVNGGALMR